MCTPFGHGFAKSGEHIDSWEHVDQWCSSNSLLDVTYHYDDSLSPTDSAH